ncbi:MAG: DNA polymerase Y family protein [Dehalococcoidia bacterium]
MKVACVLVTHLPMKAELRRHPELRGSPVIITQVYGSDQAVLDSSPEARGVTSGMPLSEALSRCKQAALLLADEPYYQTAFAEIIDALEQRSPLLEPGDLGCVYVGLEGLEAMYGGEARLITTLLQAIPEHFNPRVGVAGGKFPSYVAAVITQGGQATRVPPDSAGFLRQFSVDFLPLSWEDKNRLRRFGLHTLGQVADLPPGAIQAQLGLAGKRVWELAQGTDPSPLVPQRREEVISEYLSFPSPAITRDAILTGVEVLLGRAFSRREVKGKYVRSTTVEGRIYRQPPWLKRLAFKEAIGSKDRALFIFKNALETVSLPGPLEDITLTLTGLTGESGVQSSLFADVRQREQLREMMRQLEVQLGVQPPIYQVRDIEPWSRTPERRQALVVFDP